MAEIAGVSCKELSEKLVDFVEGELSPEENSAFREHLDRCELCEQLVMSYLKTIFILKQLHKIEPPADLVQRLRDYLTMQLKI